MDTNQYSTAVQAFRKAQSEMGKAPKSAKNPFHRSQYAPLDEVIDTVLPPFHANGFAMMQVGGADEHGHFMSTQMVHENGQKFECKIYVPLETYDSKQGKCLPIDMQGLGSAITYAKRYGLHALTGLSTEDDDGNRAVGKANAQVLHGGNSKEAALVKPSFDEPPLNASNKSDWRMWVDKQKTYIKGSTETYQLNKWGRDNTKEFEALQEYSREMTAELKDFYQQHWEKINSGERR